MSQILNRKLLHLVLLIIIVSTTSAIVKLEGGDQKAAERLEVIFDTDTNNEVDDQHALAYLLFNSKFFDVKGVTVNATSSGGEINEHYNEAQRVLKLCGKSKLVPLLRGSNKDFNDIKNFTGNHTFDGSAAVNFIIEQAKSAKRKPLTILAVGKLTNVALAVKKSPSIIPKIRLVWLGSNYPESGEYNLDNDIEAMQYLLGTAIHFEIVTVRYGKSSGTDHIKVSKELIDSIMPGLGPKSELIKGRHNGLVSSFGDYSVELFNNIKLSGYPPSRSLYDMAAVAILKNSNWAVKREIPCPVYSNGRWYQHLDNPRKIFVWEYFKKDQIINDFFATMKEAK